MGEQIGWNCASAARQAGRFPRGCRHGGRVLQRARSSGAGEQPLEIQLLEFPSAQALAAYQADGRRQALAGERAGVIARTDIIEVQLTR